MSSVLAVQHVGGGGLGGIFLGLVRSGQRGIGPPPPSCWTAPRYSVLSCVLAARAWVVGTAPHSVDTYVANTKTYFYTEFLASNDLLLFGITYHSADSPKLQCSSVAVTKKASTLFLVEEELYIKLPPRKLLRE